MFRSYAFTEMSYPFLPAKDIMRSNRIDVGSSFYDPDSGYELYSKYYDIYRAADELGLEIMVNEHHTTATCTNAVVPLSMAIIARETKRARILTLGNPLAHRADPVRVAEEMATVDVISRGRVDVGFVRGIPQETIAVNSTAIDMKERYWEALELILKAWTTHDGPFNWEGRFFHHREVNVWPRCHQTPHPPVWAPTTSPSSAGELAERGFTVAAMASGKVGTAAIFGAYRARAAELGMAEPPFERFAYSPLVYVGDSNAQAEREGVKLQHWFREATRHPIQYSDIPGYAPAKARAMLMKIKATGGDVAGVLVPAPGEPSIGELGHLPMDVMTSRGYMMVGDPDSVYRQLVDFFDAVGGFGNLLMMVQYHSMTLDDTCRSMERFTRDVLPRFREEVYEPTIRGEREIRRAPALAR
ncbi:MAG: LLM class flavin-dependent oxidoreductase [Ilumatobacteraceae bacterium]